MFVAIFLMLGLTSLFSLTAIPVKAAHSVDVSNYTELVNAINAAVDGDTINITQDITVSAQVEITKTLTIEGNGHTVSVPVPALNDSGVPNSGPSDIRVFHSYASGSTITMNDLTIKGGKPSGFGGGIYNETGTILKLTGVTISNSSASIGGGGLISRGVVYLKDSNISRNGAGYGGGFLNYPGAKMFVENSTVSENRSTSDNGGGGAGENNGGLYINNSTFSNNKSTELGGAINNYGGTLYAVNSTFTGNVAYGSFSGGAIANHNGSATVVNSIFVYNYRNTGSLTVPVYALNDISAYGMSSPAAAYYCIFHATDNSVTADASNIAYSGAANGSDNTIFVGGATTKVLAADGTELGTNTVFQPLLIKVFKAATSVVMLKTGSPALAAGAKIGFTNGSGTPTIGYYNGASWVTLTGSGAGSYEITQDQNYNNRGGTPSVGAIETTATDMYMLKVNSAANGTVDGGTVYGDVYDSGTDVTLAATANNGYSFVRWDYVLGGSGTASTSNPYTVTVAQDTTLVPVFILPAPVAPSGVTVSTITTSSIAFSWTDNSNNETGFVTGYSLNGSSYTDQSSITGTSRTLTSLNPNTKYWLHVAATNAGGNSAYTATTDGIYTYAVAPTSASAVANSPSAITVSWSGGTASGYQASYAGGSSAWTTGSSYKFTGLACETSYTFSIKAKNGDGVETGSISVSQSTPACGAGFIVPAKPDVTNLSIAISDDSVTFSSIPSGITQLAVSATPDFADTPWEDMSKKDELFKQYANVPKLYVKFRAADGGVSDVVIYEGNNKNSGTGFSQILNDGDIVKTADNFDVYIIKLKNGKLYKRLILSPSVFNSYQHLKWGNIKVISQAQMDQYITSSLVKETTDTIIYTLTAYGDTGERKAFDVSSSYDADSVYEINAVDRDSYELAK